VEEALAIQKADLEQIIYKVTEKKMSLDQDNIQSYLHKQNRDGFESISINRSLSLLAKNNKNK